MFPILKKDDVVQLIRYDELVIAFENQQCEKYKALKRHSNDMIRQKLSRLDRFLQVLKNKYSEITDFASIYYPRYSNTCTEAINCRFIFMWKIL